MKWAVPFIIGTPTDVTQQAALQAPRTRAAELYPRLEAIILACQHGCRGHSKSTSHFTPARKLVFAFFELLAGIMLPPPHVPPAEP